MRKAPPPSPDEPEFDFSNNLPAGMETFTVRFLSAWFRTSAQHWINLVEQGTLKAVDLRSPGTSKSMLRIPRAALITYLNAKTE
jgi:hypothetical protein